MHRDWVEEARAIVSKRNLLLMNYLKGSKESGTRKAYTPLIGDSGTDPETSSGSATDWNPGRSLSSSFSRSLRRIIPPMIDRRPAIEELFAKGRRQYLVIARRILRNEADAEDAVQDAALLALLHIDYFEGRSALSSWLTRIVINASLMKLRDRFRTFESLDVVDDGMFETRAEKLVDDSPGPERRAISREFVESILDRIELRTSERYRMALSLNAIGYSMRESARVLGISESAIKSRLWRVRRVAEEFVS